ncbi:MAG: hypothetical protein FJX45_10425 [Alphaproteobacteria bacterium]|nr:hypothetical protein [Alphaproteobacteria bacterium]MBM3654820.1 hypothetical protein [Alphaproteobacteria bacterium]
MPRTVEGAAALAACSSPGVMKRAGMAGAICGVDYAQALLLASHCDRQPFLELLVVAETGMLAGVAKKQD